MILSPVEELIEKILAQRKDLTREQVQSLIEAKKLDFEGLLLDQGAARLVAEELLVETEPVAVPSMKVRDLVAGLNDATLSGKVVSIEPSRDFVRQDGSAGRVLSVVLEDETAKVRCAIWDDKADQVTKYGEITGKSITIRYGYTRTGLAGEVELNVGERSEITLTAEAGTSSPTLVEQEHPREEVEQDSNPKRLAELDSYLESKISELESEAKRLKSMRSAIRRIYE